MAIKKIEKKVADNNPSGNFQNAAKASASEQKEYLNARRRTKTAIKITIGVVVALVVAAIIGIAACSINANKVDAGKVKIAESSSSLTGKNYQDVQTLLSKEGFTNIELRPEGDLKIGVLHDEGDVETVSIDGKTSFTSGQQFDSGAKVVIAYHSYPAQSNTNASNTNASSNSNTNSSANASNNAAKSGNTTNTTTNTNNTNSSANGAKTQ